jgi:hypothetical protein
MSTASFTNFDCNERPTEITLSFGKHKGESLCDIPLDYLEWLLDNSDYVKQRPTIADAITAELEQRRKQVVGRALAKPVERHRAPSRYDEVTMELARMIVEAGAEALKEMCSADLKFTAAYSFLRNQIALEEVNDGTLVL